MECLSHMANSGDDSTYYDYTKKWIESVNRGGLFLVNDITLSFFKSVEIKIQELLPNHLSSSGEKKFLIDTIQLVYAGYRYYKRRGCIRTTIHNYRVLGDNEGLCIDIYEFSPRE